MRAPSHPTHLTYFVCPSRGFITSAPIPLSHTGTILSPTPETSYNTSPIQREANRRNPEGVFPALLHPLDNGGLPKVPTVGPSLLQRNEGPIQANRNPAIVSLWLHNPDLGYWCATTGQDSKRSGSSAMDAKPTATGSCPSHSHQMAHMSESQLASGLANDRSKCRVSREVLNRKRIRSGRSAFRDSGDP